MITRHAATRISVTAIAAFTLALAGQAQAQNPAPPSQSIQAPANAPAAKRLNNATCPVSGEPIGSMGDEITVTYKNSIVSLCCKGCVEKFNAKPDAYLKKALESKKRANPAPVQSGKSPAAVHPTPGGQSAATIEVKNAHCPVSGKAIGSMGEGIPAVYNGYQVTLCCAGCKGKFAANPEQYLKAALADSKRP